MSRWGFVIHFQTPNGAPRRSLIFNFQLRWHADSSEGLYGYLRRRLEIAAGAEEHRYPKKHSARHQSDTGVADCVFPCIVWISFLRSVRASLHNVNVLMRGLWLSFCRL